MPYLLLTIAIFAEVVATSALKASESFTRPLPTLVVVVGYSVAFYFLSRCLAVLPVGIAYAIWSGLGVVLITLLGVVIYQQKLDLPAILGVGLILAGVVVINLFSNSVPH